MAYYAYKTVRDLIPKDFIKKYIATAIENGYVDSVSEAESMYSEPGHDGGLWLVAAAYIEYLKSQIKE